jgi:glyoxylase-like metal-dependent hydrolase (beta-lactamase superfamily II)
MSDDGIFQKVTDGVYYFSTLGSFPIPVSGSYVIMGEKVYLVETGTQDVASKLMSSLSGLGIGREDVAGIIVTHIHLDHSGGAGWLVEQMPWLKVYVHRNGAGHLIEPSRLLASADKVYGGREVVEKVHGAILPIPEENVIPLDETTISAGGGVSFRVMSAPGHAPHHVLIFEESKKLAFVGELPGHYVPDDDFLYPALAPPGFDYGATLVSLKKLRALAPEKLCFSQFGFTDRVNETISLSEKQLSHVRDVLLPLNRKGCSPSEMVQALMDAPMYEHVNELPGWSEGELILSTVLGFQHYFARNENLW